MPPSPLVLSPSPWGCDSLFEDFGALPTLPSQPAAALPRIDTALPQAVMGAVMGARIWLPLRMPSFPEVVSSGGSGCSITVGPWAEAVAAPRTAGPRAVEPPTMSPAVRAAKASERVFIREFRSLCGDVH